MISNPAQLLKPSTTDTVSCEYLSLETMERWIICVLYLFCSYLNYTLINILCFTIFFFFLLVGFLLCHQTLQQPSNQQHNQDGNISHKLWIAALESNWSIVLFRDETVAIHSFVQSFFDTLKGYSKRVSEVKEAYSHATQKAYVFQLKSY